MMILDINLYVQKENIRNVVELQYLKNLSKLDLNFSTFSTTTNHN